MRRQELEDSMNREIAFRRQLVDLMMQKERLISEAERIEDLKQIELLRNQIEELEKEIHRVQLQLAEEIAHKMEITKKKSKLK